MVRCDSLHLGSCSTDLKFSAETLIWQSAGIPLIFNFNLLCMLKSYSSAPLVGVFNYNYNSSRLYNARCKIVKLQFRTPLICHLKVAGTKSCTVTLLAGLLLSLQQVRTTPDLFRHCKLYTVASSNSNSSSIAVVVYIVVTF